MNINLRNAVITNIQGLDSTQIRETIHDAISKREEKTLPGLGVMFELLWSNADNSMKDSIIDSLLTSLK